MFKISTILLTLIFIISCEESKPEKKVPRISKITNFEYFGKSENSPLNFKAQQAIIFDDKYMELKKISGTMTTSSNQKYLINSTEGKLMKISGFISFKSGRITKFINAENLTLDFDQVDFNPKLNKWSGSELKLNYFKQFIQGKSFKFDPERNNLSMQKVRAKLQF